MTRFLQAVFLTFSLVIFTGIDSAWAATEPSLVPLESVIVYDFENLALGPVGEGGPAKGEPDDINFHATAQVIADGIDGQSLEVTKATTGSAAVWFHLPGDVGLKSGQARFRFQIQPPIVDDYRVMFRRPGSAAESYLNINLFASGNIGVSSGASAAVTVGTYSAGQVLDFTVDFDLDQMSWSLWLQGEREIEDSAISIDIVEGLGRIGFGIPPAGTQFNTLLVDNVDILLNAPGTTLLDADFNDKVSGEPIGTGGADMAEPVSVSAQLETWIDTVTGSDQALYVLKEAAATVDDANTEWNFINAGAVGVGWLDLSFDLNVLEASNNHFFLFDSATEEELIRIETTAADQHVRVRFPEQAEGDVVGSYTEGEAKRVRIVCEMEARFCSVAVDGQWVVAARALSASTSGEILIDRFYAGIAAVSPAFSLFGINNLMVSATMPSALPYTAEFVQQPSDTVCANAFSPPVSVLVRDGTGVPVAGEWMLALNEHTSVLGWGGLIGNDSAGTVDGQVEFPGVTVMRGGQGARLQATVVGHSPTVRAISQSFDVLPGPPYHAYIVEDDLSGYAGVAIPEPVWVGAWDECWTPVPAGTEITLLIHQGPAGASLSGNVGLANDDGEVAFEELVFSRPGDYVLAAHAGGQQLEGLTDTVVIDAAPPETAQFTVQPAAGVVDSPISPTIEVSVLDQFGNPVFVTVEVTLSIESGPSDAVITGHQAETVDGVARFPALTLSQPGSYELRAAAEGVNSASEPISDTFQIQLAEPEQQLIFRDAFTE